MELPRSNELVEERAPNSEECKGKGDTYQSFLVHVSFVDWPRDLPIREHQPSLRAVAVASGTYAAAPSAGFSESGPSR